MQPRLTRHIRVLGLAIMAAPCLIFAQTQAPQTQSPTTPRPGWRRVDDPNAGTSANQTPPPAAPETAPVTAPVTAMVQDADPMPAGSPPPAGYGQQPERRDQYGSPVHGPQQPSYNPSGGFSDRNGYNGTPGPGAQSGMQPPLQGGPPPAQLTLKQGTYLTVRVNQPLSSDHNQSGDAFSATLVRPVVVDGFVVAQTGQTLGGHVVEAQKAGRVSGVSRLGVQLTDLTLVDGQNVPIHSELISRNGNTSIGRDVAGVGGTTALGAAVGAAADWGRGAAIGAGAGAAVGLLGVLLTRGQPTVLYPEQVLTFRVETPILIATDRAPQAFRWVEPEDYNQGLQASRPTSPRPACGPYGCPPPTYYGGGYYGPYSAYGYWGPGFGFYYGPRFYGHYYRGWRR